jgi:hypothetical protein
LSASTATSAIGFNAEPSAGQNPASSGYTRRQSGQLFIVGLEKLIGSVRRPTVGQEADARIDGHRG